LGQAKEGGTEITLKASGKPARILSNAFAEKMSMIEAPAAPFPEQFGLSRPLAEVDESWLAVYAGQSAPLSRAIPAKDLMTLLEAETDAAFSRFL
jgi:nitronate monooxygenase